MCTQLMRSQLSVGVSPKMVKSSGMFVTPGELSGVSKASSASARASTTSLLSPAALGVRPKTPGPIRFGIRLPMQRRQTLTMTRPSTQCLSLNLTQRQAVLKLWISSHAGRAAVLQSLNSLKVRKSTVPAAGNSTTWINSLQVLTGETRMAQTIFHGTRTSISPNTVVLAGLRPPHLPSLIDSTFLMVLAPKLLSALTPRWSSTVRLEAHATVATLLRCLSTLTRTDLSIRAA